MKVTFSISHQFDDKYAVKYIIPAPGRSDMSFVSVITYSDFRLSTLVSKARQVVYARLYNLRQQGITLPPSTSITIEWDKAVADLPDSMKRQNASAYSLHVSPAGTMPTAPAEPALLEVKRVNGVWTIVVHDKPLLTWDEACKILKEKVDGNEE